MFGIEAPKLNGRIFAMPINETLVKRLNISSDELLK